MSWHDPAGPWQTAMRRGIRLRRVGLVVLALVWGLASVVLLYTSAWVGRTPGGADGGQLLVWLPTLVFIAVFAVQIVMQWRRERRLCSLLHRVPSEDGLICPACQTSLADRPAESACICCTAPYTHERVRDYWEAYPFVTTPADRWGRRVRDATAATGWRRWWASALGNLAIVGGFMSFVILSMYLRGGTVLVTILQALPLILPATLIAGGFRFLASGMRRTGDSRHCARCDYQQAPGGAPSPRCPECGTVWGNRSGIVIGRRPPDSKRRIRGGVALVAVGMLSGALPLLPGVMGRGWGMNLFPTHTLIEQVIRARLSDSDEWVELNRRTLSPTQEQRLATGLLDKRLVEGRLSSDAGAWFAKALAAGRVPQALRERYYREQFSAWIEAPARVRVGEPFTVSLRSNLIHDSSRPPGVDEVVCFGGFYAGLSAALQRRTHSDYAILLQSPEYRPSAELIAEAVGPFRIRAEFWFGVGAGVIGRIEWLADGTPALPATPVWFERVVVEHTVDVLP